MKNRFETCLNAIVAFGAVNLLLIGTAFAQTRVSSNPGYGVGANFTAQAQINQSQLARGTSDSGGGTAIDYKVLEAYIIDPTTLEAYKKIVQPLFANIRKKNDQGVEEVSGWVEIFKYRTWYLAPVKLQNVSKDSLGVSFFGDITQQIARQSMKEIWIDKTIFDKMSLEEQGRLLLHEAVMTAYFVRFMTLIELCNKGQLVGFSAENGPDCDSKIIQDFSQSLPPEPIRPLNQDDNESIRYVTNWIYINARKPLLESELMQVMRLKNFDRRFFGKKTEEAKIENKNIPIREFYDLLRATDLTGFMPDTCWDLVTKANQPCHAELVPKKINYEFDSGSIAFIDGISLTVSTDQSNLGSFNVSLGSEVTLNAFRDDQGRVFYSTGALSTYLPSVAVGQNVHSLVFIFVEETIALLQRKELKLHSMLLKKSVVVSINPNRDVICETRDRRARNLYENGFIVRDLTSSPSPQELIFKDFPVHPYCTKDNVKAR